jgi:restriction system protein
MPATATEAELTGFLPSRGAKRSGGMGKKGDKSNSRFAQFLQPLLDAIRKLGGSARPSEAKETILRSTALDPAYLGAVNKTGESKFGNDVDWARFYLVRAGYLDASKRGVWSLTERGRTETIDAAKAAEIIRGVTASTGGLSTGDEPQIVGPSDTPSFADRALHVIRSLPPAGFEGLCQRLLRESGFEEVNVTGRSGDGGIDGQGILKLNSFVSFRVLFQCKRYKESVGPSTIRDFRGAMAGRAEKGIILTTGYFTSQAESQASRDGAQPIQLVDGEALIQLLSELELGLTPVRSFEIDERFFDQFREARD